MAVAVVERFKQEVMYGLSAGTKKVAVVERFKTRGNVWAVHWDKKKWPL